MSVNWNVEDALNQVVNAIIGSAHGLTLSTSAVTMIKNGYRPDFEDQHANGGDWDLAEHKILELSGRIGNRSAMLTIAKWLAGGGNLASFPTELDEDSVRLMCYWVATIDCPTSQGAALRSVILGAFCPRAVNKFPGSLEQRNRVDALLAQERD